MSQASDIRDLLDAASTSIGTADWDTAETKLMQAQAIMAGVPESQFDGAMMRYRDTIESLLERVNRKVSRAAGVQSTLISMAPVLPQDDYS